LRNSPLTWHNKNHRCGRCIDNIFLVWSHGPERLQNLLSHLSNLRPCIQFTTQIESQKVISFLDVLVVRRRTTLASKDYRKHTHTDGYFNFNFNHPPYMKRSLNDSLHTTASTICQGRQYLVKGVSSLRRDLQLNGYFRGPTDLVSRPNTEDNPLGSAYIPRVKDVSEKLKCIGKTTFQTKHIFRSSHMETRPDREPLQTARFICNVPCECGRSFISETGRHLAVLVRERRHTLQQSLLEKSKLSQRAYEAGHAVGLDNSRILQIENNSRYRKYKESDHVACLTNPISQPSLDISTSLILY
jgi:hypothetical protein